MLVFVVVAVVGWVGGGGGSFLFFGCLFYCV